MKKTNRSSIFYPDYISRSVLDLDLKELRKKKITHLVFDIDETLVPKKHNQLTEEYTKFLISLQAAGFSIIIGSNSNRDFGNITKHIKAVVVKPGTLAFKPLKQYYNRVIATSGTSRAHIAMIGDRVVNDIIGGNIAGLTTILVEPYAQKRGKGHSYYLRLNRKTK